MASLEMHQMDIQRALSVSLAETDDLAEGLNLCLEACMQISGMDCGGIYLFNDTSGALELIVHQGFKKKFVKDLMVYDKDSENVALVLKGKPLFIQFKNLNLTAIKEQKSEILHAFATIPLFDKSKVIGCINIASHNFDEISDISRIGVETIAAQVGIVIARLKAKRQLQESEEHFRSLMQSAEHFAIYRLVASTIDPHKLEVVFVSPSIKEIMGVSNPMKFETWFENIHEDDRERVTKANSKAFQTLRFDEIMRINHPHKNEPRWIHAISLGLTTKNGKLRYINGIINDITELKHAEEVLSEKELVLQAKTTKLEETNTAMKVLLQKRNEDKTFMQAQVLSNIKKLVAPYFKKLRKSPLDESQKAYIEVIESNLQEIFPVKSIGFTSEYYGLTRSELIVADLIQHGKKTKEIAALLSLSPKTVEVHRNNIRKKLGITNRKVNLQTYLHSIDTP